MRLESEPYTLNCVHTYSRAMGLLSKPYTLYSVYTYSRAIPASAVSCSVCTHVLVRAGGPSTVLGVARMLEKSSSFLPEPAVKVLGGVPPPPKEPL